MPSTIEFRQCICIHRKPPFIGAMGRNPVCQVEVIHQSVISLIVYMLHLHGRINLPRIIKCSLSQESHRYGNRIRRLFTIGTRHNDNLIAGFQRVDRDLPPITRYRGRVVFIAYAYLHNTRLDATTLQPGIAPTQLLRKKRRCCLA